MRLIEQEYLSGERALFKGENLQINNSTFADGESPLKESKNIDIKNTTFQWKYPLWYSNDIKVVDSVLLETARSGIWYTKNINIKNSVIEAPKTFRRSENIDLENVNIPLAQETLWNCKKIKLENVQARGDYFAMNSENISVNNFVLTGNYAFDGCKNIEVHNATMLSKDAFWNCENVTVYDSKIVGEYLAWNSKNLTFVNCIIESLQGLCYIENLKLINCKIINTTLSFEYCSNICAEVTTTIDSVKNPISGTIKAKCINEVILDDSNLDFNKVNIIVEEDRNEI